MLQFVHMVQHFGCELLLCWLLFRVHAYFRLKAVGMLPCNDLPSARRRFFECLSSAAVELLFFEFVIHFLVEDIISVFETVPGVLPYVVAVLLRFETDNVVR
jgi:hypothetical protein